MLPRSHVTRIVCSRSFDTGSSSFGDSSFGSSASSGLGLDSGPGSGSSSGDAELQSFLMLEQQKAQMQTMIHKMNDICWETCVGSQAANSIPALKLHLQLRGTVHRTSLHQTICTNALKSGGMM
ncbi:putative mitochondrial import inner membrane translocase subunit Tim8 [Penaeus vannamei]|uniref:Mitochondrial import inner membrane translocase subunit n=1 Tax=Penaeus vannamei TaxID=6689 RepID=A0A423U8H2_PENVA|nr:putative mitochondrial import inner membrane translocase subunit Tim8 [Penaeus vannamei]